MDWSFINIPVSGGWDLVAGAVCFFFCWALPVHFEEYGLGSGAIVGDTPIQSAEKTVGSVASVLAGGVSVPSSIAEANGPITAGEAGSYGDLKSRSTIGDELTPHHMPQEALGFTPKSEGGALVLPQNEHIMTRTYGYNGAITAQEDSVLGFRDVLAQDIRDVRNIAKQTQGSSSYYNSGLFQLINYYYSKFPGLISKKE